MHFDESRQNVAGLRRELIASRLDSHFSDATTLLAFMVAPGRSKQFTREVVGRLVRSDEERGCTVVVSRSDVFESIDPGCSYRVYELVGVPRAMAALRSSGAPMPAAADRQLAYWHGRRVSNSVAPAESYDG